jgi:two-component system cell cycle response regulator DivK
MNRILMIEDNEQNRYLATRFLLQARGWEMVHASDGPQRSALAGRSIRR